MLGPLLELVRTAIQETILTLGYVGIALVMFAENVFPPIPSELVMPFAGWLARDGKMDLIASMVAGTVGTVGGAVVLYYLGVVADEPIIRRFVRTYGRFWLISEADVDRTLSFFERHGTAVVFFGRMIPLIRSLISIPAGMNRMPMVPFLVYTTLGSAIWTAALTLGGWVLGENWEAIIGIVNQYERIFIVAGGIAILYVAGQRLIPRLRTSRA
jgi:membrane protein DedA with SNARE-associated domain